MIRRIQLLLLETVLLLLLSSVQVSLRNPEAVQDHKCVKIL